MNEAETRAELIDPALKETGWENESLMSTGNTGNIILPLERSKPPVVLATALMPTMSSFTGTACLRLSRLKPMNW